MASLNIDSWSPEEVSKWIKGLGAQFESYCQSFVDEEITGKALLTINAEYLKELSIENASDQNVILEAVNCLLEVDTCLRGETVHGQVVNVSEKTNLLIEQLEKEGKEANEEDLETRENSMKVAGEVYQLAKKLLSWLIRSPFSEMNACWPLKDSVCRVVRDMTDESLLKNRGHLQENLKKLQTSFDNFLKEKDMHEVFKQTPILTTEEIPLEGEGLGIGITTSHNIHTVNSVATESPAGKNKNIKNGDEIVKVNKQCVIAWPQKNVVTLMKSNPDSVSLTLKKLPPVEGPLNKPVDKPGTPLSEMEVIMDRARITAERTTRVEMKEAGIKEETSLEMQAIENENEMENAMAKIEEKIEEDSAEEEEVAKEENETDEKETKEEEVVEEKKENEEEKNDEDDGAKEGEKKTDDENEKTKETQEEAKEPAKVEEKSEEQKPDETVTKEVEDKMEEKKEEVAETNNDEKLERNEEDKKKDGENIKVITEADLETGLPKVVENLVKSDETQAKEKPAEGTKVHVDTTKDETEKQIDEKKAEEPVEDEKKKSEEDKTIVVNGEPQAAAEENNEEVKTVEPKKSKENTENKSETAESKTTWYDDNITAQPKDTPKDKDKSTGVASKKAAPAPQQNGETAEASPPKINVEPIKGSPDKKPARPELPKMKMGSVKTVTVKGANTKQVEILSTSTSKVVMREKKVNGAPNKRISCIELGEADCEGWLTKKSGGHGLTPTRWRRHWCVLKEDHLYYYKTSFDREAGGVFDITGYTVSNAPEVKKAFAFRCEKDGAKKYQFHADNEVDREMWVRCLNAAARGERKQKEALATKLSDESERKSSVSLKPASNRGRTASVLAGIRFNYYDDDLEEERKKSQEPNLAATTAKDVNESAQNEQKEASETGATSDILKIAAGVEENGDTCKVTPVVEPQDKGTEEKPAAAPEVKDVSVAEGSKSEGTEVKSDAEEQTGTTEPVSDSKESESTPAADEGSKHEDTEDKSGTEGQADTPTATSDSKEESEPNVGDATKCEDVEDKSGSKEQVSTSVAANDRKEPEEATYVTGDAKEPEGTSDEKDDSKKTEGTSEEKDDSKKTEGTSDEKDDSKKTEGTSEEKEETNEQVGTSEDNEASVSPQGATKDDKVAEQTQASDQKAPEDGDAQRDEFKEVAESIKEADINIDGTERPSPEALLRKLSVNSKDEILDKVIKLRLLKQSVKDREQSIDAIEELLSSDVTPETIAEWRTRYESVVGSSTNSSDLNENSQL